MTFYGILNINQGVGDFFLKSTDKIKMILQIVLFCLFITETAVVVVYRKSRNVWI